MSVAADRDPGAILLLGFAGHPDPLASRLRALGFAVLAAEDRDAAARRIRADEPSVGALLLAGGDALPDAAQSLRGLAELSPRALRFVVWCRPATPPDLAPLRALGPGLALREPCTQTELRFVLNHVLYDARQGESRLAARVPTRLLARVESPGGARDARVYSLSLGGAFLETARPSQPGSELALELPLPSGCLRLGARVLSANIPGGFFRRQLPFGMGVRFGTLAAGAREPLERYLEERAVAFQL